MKNTKETKRRISTQHLIFTGAIFVLVVLIAVPLALVLYKSFMVDGTLSVGNYIEVFSTKSNYLPFFNTLKLGALTVIFSTLIGIILAWLVARTDIPFKGLLETIFLIPYMIPPFIGAIAWTQLLSPRVGYINKFFMGVFGTHHAPFNIYSMLGIVWVMALYNYPFVFITVRGALERMDPSLEEVARVSGAGRFRVMRDITLPLVTPAIVSGMLLVFIFTIANFGIPAIIGMRSRIYVLTTQIYRYMQMYTGGFGGVKLATALSTLLMLTAGAGLVLSRWILSRKKYTIIAGKSVRPNVVELGRWKYPILGVLAVFIFITIVAPLTSVFLTSFLKAWGLAIKPENLSLKNYRYILFGYDYTRMAIKNSFLLALSAAIATTLLGSIIAYIVVKTRLKGRRILDFLATLPYSIPGTVVAIAMILAWTGQFGINLYNTFWIILVAYVARYMFFAFRNVSASLEQIHPSLEEAARVSGATWLRNFRDIIVPLVRPGLVASFLLVFMPTLRELTISVFLVGPKTTTIGVAVYNLQEEGLYQISAALASLVIVIVFLGNYLVRKVTKVGTKTSF
ncbi:MAG: iron ABC transporter permease [Candidatus Thorarchaeota archaeon]|nr:MAG: iron ABC transporter permease [Candidatus Thorarchaeota archaeon]